MTLAELVNDIYETAFVPERWSGVLDCACQLTGSASGSLLLIDGGFIDRYKTTALTHDALARLASDKGLQSESPRAEIMVKGIENRVAWSCANDLLTSQQFAEDSIEQELARGGLGWQTAAAAALPDHKLVLFTFERRVRDGRHRAAGKAALEQLRPHLLRAALLANRLGDERARGALAALTALDTPGALLDAQGRLREANVLLTPALLDVRAGGRVVFGEPRADALLTALLGGAPRRADSIALPANGACPARVAHLVPLADAVRDPLSSATWLLYFSVVRRENGSSAALDAQLLRTLFDLSPAESRLAGALASGLNLAQAALSIGIQVSTARSYLERVFDKTGCHRQSELVHLLAGIASVRSFGSDGSADIPAQ